MSVFFISCVSPDEAVEDTNTLRPKEERKANTNTANTNVVNANVANDDLVKLKDIINLPFEPEFNDFREDKVVKKGEQDRVPGPTDRKLTVVLKFSSADTKTLLEQIESAKPGYKTSIEAETWFPAELIAKSDTSGDKTLKGLGYGVEKFAKTPFNTGSLVKIDDTDYFVLVLQTR